MIKLHFYEIQIVATLNSHPSALPHLYHSAWQLIAKDPYIMSFTLETLNLIPYYPSAQQNHRNKNMGGLNDKFMKKALAAVWKKFEVVFIVVIAIVVLAIVGVLYFLCKHIKRKEESTSWSVEQVDKMIEYLSKDAKDPTIFEDLQNLKNKVEKMENDQCDGLSESLRNKV